MFSGDRERVHWEGMSLKRKVADIKGHSRRGNNITFCIADSCTHGGGPHTFILFFPMFLLIPLKTSENLWKGTLRRKGLTLSRDLNLAHE